MGARNGARVQPRAVGCGGAEGGQGGVRYGAERGEEMLLRVPEHEIESAHRIKYGLEPGNWPSQAAHTFGQMEFAQMLALKVQIEAPIEAAQADWLHGSGAESTNHAWLHPSGVGRSVRVGRSVPPRLGWSITGGRSVPVGLGPTLSDRPS